MKKLRDVLLVLFGCILWLLDFENIFWYILIPVGILAVGIFYEGSWKYYLIAYGIYAVINLVIHLLGKKIDTRVDKWFEEQEQKTK